MNQILDYGNNSNSNNYNNDNNKKEKKESKKAETIKYNDYNNYGGGSFSGGNNQKNKEKSPMSDKVVKVFAVLMLIFAIVLIVSGVTSWLKNKKTTDDNKKKANEVVQKVEAEISAELDEESGNVKIIVESEIPIDKMVYTWDTEHENIKAGEKQTRLEADVIAPFGEHVLHVQVTDVDGNKTTKDFTFTSDSGMDTTKPEITLTLTTDKKLLITAKDDTSIAYVTYTWNEEETVTMEPDEEGTKEFEFEIDIPMGENTIVVIAVDGSDSANATTTSKVFTGTTKPEINYGFLDQEGSVLKIMCSHEKGIKSIYYTFNGQPYEWKAEEGTDAPTYLEFTQESVVGDNIMEIVVTSVDDTTAEFNPAWVYGNVVEDNNSGEEPANGETSPDDNNADQNN